MVHWPGNMVVQNLDICNAALFQRQVFGQLSPSDGSRWLFRRVVVLNDTQ